MQLYIGNKNYSSWSMRPWVVLSQFGIAFEETMVRFDDFSSQTDFKKRITRLSPAGKVPVLVDDRIVIWDSLAIVEYLAEKFPEINFGLLNLPVGPMLVAFAPRCTVVLPLCAVLVR